MLSRDDVNQLLNLCRVELTGASDAGLKAELYDVLDEFLRDTSCWKEYIPFAVTPPSPAPTTQLGWINALTYPIKPVEGQIISLDGVADQTGAFVAALLPVADGAGQNDPAVQLRHAPNSAQQYVAIVTKTVVLPINREQIPNAPEWLLRRWHKAIKSGLLGAMMNQKNKGYSDPKGAAYHLARFRKGITECRSLTLRANTKGASAWRFPQSFRSISQKGGIPVYGNGNDWTG